MDRKKIMKIGAGSLLVLGLMLTLVFLEQQEYISLWPNKSLLYKTPYNKEEPLRPPLGVMIENELLARPFQAGLADADIVYEAPTEGGITRFMALFFEDAYTGKIGPVRSARPYFLDWLHEYKGIYVHVGGSPEVLARIRKENIFDADQYFYDAYFWRENVGKTALEHTMFTDIEALVKMVGDRKLEWDVPQHIKDVRGAQKLNTASALSASEISIDFGFPSYRVAYTYDKAAGRYLRSQAKKPHVDTASQKPIAPQTVIVQRVSSWGYGDAAGRIGIKTISEGDAYVFRDSEVIKGRWKKADLEAPTVFVESDGKEIPFVALKGTGPLWIEVLPSQNTLTYK